MSAQAWRDYIAKHPWYSCWKGARRRCNDRLHKAYQSHGARGIKFLLSRDDCKFLWLRDNAGALRIPSLDRKDPDDHYTLENCRFIEFSQNSSLARPKGTVGRGIADGPLAKEMWAL